MKVTAGSLIHKHLTCKSFSVSKVSRRRAVFSKVSAIEPLPAGVARLALAGTDLQKVLYNCGNPGQEPSLEHFDDMKSEKLSLVHIVEKKDARAIAI